MTRRFLTGRVLIEMYPLPFYCIPLAVPGCKSIPGHVPPLIFYYTSGSFPGWRSIAGDVPHSPLLSYWQEDYSWRCTPFPSPESRRFLARRVFLEMHPSPSTVYQAVPCRKRIPGDSTPPLLLYIRQFSWLEKYSWYPLSFHCSSDSFPG